MKKESYIIIVAAIVVSLWISTQPVQADLVNGEFINNLNPWIVAPDGPVMWVDEDLDGDGGAFFIQDAAGVLSDSTLSQGFQLDPLSLTLSFDFLMDVVWTNGNGGETDTFTVSLLDASDAPLINVSGQQYFYSFNSNYTEDLATGVVVTGNTVSLDVSGLVSQDVTLKFNLHHEYGDSQDTTVLLDNVAVSVIPAPGAVLLGSIGLSLSGWKLRKRRTL